jgi:hypothetical protein
VTLVARWWNVRNVRAEIRKSRPVLWVIGEMRVTFLGVIGRQYSSSRS